VNADPDRMPGLERDARGFLLERPGEQRVEAGGAAARFRHPLQTVVGPCMLLLAKASGGDRGQSNMGGYAVRQFRSISNDERPVHCGHPALGLHRRGLPCRPG
jgi:hypothetical protein